MQEFGSTPHFRKHPKCFHGTVATQFPNGFQMFQDTVYIKITLQESHRSGTHAFAQCLLANGFKYIFSLTYQEMSSTWAMKPDHLTWNCQYLCAFIRTRLIQVGAHLQLCLEVFLSNQGNTPNRTSPCQPKPTNKPRSMTSAFLFRACLEDPRGEVLGCRLTWNQWLFPIASFDHLQWSLVQVLRS